MTYSSEYFGCEADDLHEVPLAEFAGDGAEDAGAARILILVDNDDRVVVEPEDAAVFTLDGLPGANNDAANNFALLHLPSGGSLTDVRGDDVTDSGLELVLLADDADHLGHTGASVIGHIESATNLQHKKGREFTLVFDDFN